MTTADDQVGGAGGATADPAPNDDWASQVVDGLDALVDTIRSKTTIPVLKLARGAVFVLMASLLGFAAILLATVGGVRVLDAYLPGNVWSAHLLLGGICVAGGWLCFRRSAPPPPRP